ncbi:hypothetical protein HanIR_Chr15g0764651 [Helianthus annuus]|nr:hypothetical protein HanIR_Chr15g0764651 [Helianthus annuus]
MKLHKNGELGRWQKPPTLCFKILYNIISYLRLFILFNDKTGWCRLKLFNAPPPHKGFLSAIKVVEMWSTIYPPSHSLFHSVAKLEISDRGSKMYIPKNFIKLGGRKRIYQKISIRKLHALHY